MRKIDWSKKLTADDVTWLRQAGLTMANGKPTEDAIRDNLGDKTPEEEIKADMVTRSVLDPTGRTSLGVVATSETVTPPEDNESGETDDNYDTTGVTDLVAEVRRRNEKAKAEGTPEIHVEGTGAEGKIRKGDLIKALRLNDQIDN